MSTASLQPATSKQALAATLRLHALLSRDPDGTHRVADQAYVCDWSLSSELAVFARVLIRDAGALVTVVAAVVTGRFVRPRVHAEA